tara:strand:+ start:650 stop:901 length:252 start_codon:yes stop_codon:yes gene_type:complete
MIKAGDLVGWSDHFHRERPDLNELDDFGVVVSVFKKKQNFGFPEIDRIRIAWVKDPDEAIDEYPFCWAEGEMETGALVILSRS